MRDRPAETVLAGISMGAGRSTRYSLGGPTPPACYCYMASPPSPHSPRQPAGLAACRRHGRLRTDFRVTAWLDAATRCGADAQVFTYSHVGHFYTDTGLPDYDERATASTWQRALGFLQTLAR